MRGETRHFRVSTHPTPNTRTEIAEKKKSNCWAMTEVSAAKDLIQLMKRNLDTQTFRDVLLVLAKVRHKNVHDSQLLLEALEIQTLVADDTYISDVYNQYLCAHMSNDGLWYQAGVDELVVPFQ